MKEMHYIDIMIFLKICLTTTTVLNINNVLIAEVYKSFKRYRYMLSLLLAVKPKVGIAAIRCVRRCDSAK